MSQVCYHSDKKALTFVCVVLETGDGCCVCWVSTLPLAHAPTQHSLNVCVCTCLRRCTYTHVCTRRPEVSGVFCMYACLCRCTYTYVCTWKSEVSGVFYHSPLCFLNQDLSLKMEFTDWLLAESQGSSHLCLLSPGITGPPPRVALYVSSGIPNSGPHPCMQVLS